MHNDEQTSEPLKHQVSAHDTKQGLSFIGGRDENDAATGKDH